jgi:hypothetical protein
MALRLAYALALAPDLHGLGDDIFYRSAAFELAAGEGYRGGLEAFFGSTWPSAAHPPLYPLVLSVLPRLGVEGVAAMRSVNVVFGSVAVLLTGLVASRLADAERPWRRRRSAPCSHPSWPRTPLSWLRRCSASW